MTRADAAHGGFADYRWVSASRAAWLLGIPLPRLYRLVDTGELAAYRIAGEVRLLLADVERWQSAHGTAEPPSPPPEGRG